jgi:hypothetical protein
VQETTIHNKVGLQTTDRDFTAREFHRQISFFFCLQGNTHFLKKKTQKKTKKLEITNDQVFRKQWLGDIVRTKIS